jgi:hypothetical protein
MTGVRREQREREAPHAAKLGETNLRELILTPGQALIATIKDV